MITIKTKALESIINNEIKELICLPSCEEASFCIHEEKGYQVQILITKNTDVFSDQILPEYLGAT